MNYEQLWKGLKDEYERLLGDCKAKTDSVEGKEPSNDLEELRWAKAREDYNTYGCLIDQMSRLENNQTKSERELIENAIDELKCDRLAKRYRIKCLHFTRGDENDKWTFSSASIDKYYDYHLYNDGYHWFIVFYDKGNLVTYMSFDSVNIEYWGEGKTSL